MELVTGAIGSLLPKLGELLKEEYGLQTGVKKKIEILSRELEAAHAVLRKIGDVPPYQLDELVRLWVCDIREASYDMEDIVDAFLVRFECPEPTDTNMVGRFLEKVGRLIKKMKDRHKISSLVDEIKKKLEEVAARHSRYTLNNIDANPVASTAIDPRILNLYKSAKELVGIEGPRDELINKLSPGDDVDMPDLKMKIISIVGFGGLGKTTLAKVVYDHFKPQFKCSASVPVHKNPDMNKAADDQLKPRFHCGAFVPVGRNPDMRKVFRDILIGLDEEKYTYLKLKGLDENQLMAKLNEFAKEKRCIIVIDDIWDKKSWELIRCAMQETNCGSRLIITTRIDEVAAHADEAYKIQPLSRDNSEKLLYARIVDGEENYFDNPSAEACEKILKKCGGVPLAIITIASLLASKPGVDWSEVYNSIGFGHEDNDVVDNTRKILSFSYYDLSPNLKACLLYLSVFPEDYLIEKNSLIWKWIAEGFIPEDNATRVGLLELGERYFNELINRNMILPKEIKYEGYIDACSVHDMVLDMIHSLLSNENFVTIQVGDEQKKHSGSIARRLALQRVEKHNIDQLANSTVEKVRSLIASQCDFGALCPRLPFLRVLDMVNCHVEEHCNKGMLDHLGSLLHLRYLGLAYTHITELPREVRYLKFLRTLDLWKSGIKELPEEVGLLTQLVCLRADRKTRAPTGLFSKLTSLQELWMWPPRAALDDDDDINDYDDYDDDAKIQFVTELGLLRELRVLRTDILVISESMRSALLESLGHLCNIRDLNIGASLLYRRQTCNAEFLSHRHLRSLRLNSLLFSGLPAGIKSSLVPNLSYLRVHVVGIKEEDMETLARLPELSCLKLYSHDTRLVSMKIHTKGVGYFRKLRFLKISRTYIWFDMLGSECNSNSLSNVMPSLESLHFDVHVRSLKDMTQLGLEKLLGFHYLGRTSLQRVTTTVCCGGSHASEVEEVETALVHAAEVHPKHPTLQITREEEEDMLSPYQESLDLKSVSLQIQISLTPAFLVQAFMDVSRTPELVNKPWKLSNIVNSRHIRAMHIPDLAASSSKVIRLLFLSCKNGKGLLALSSNAVHKLWKWDRSDKNPCGESTTSVPPQLWRPEYGIRMTNDTTNANPEDTACIALSKNRSYLISSSGGKVSLFNVTTFKIMATFIAPPLSPTFLAFNPQDNNIIAIGMEDSSVHIYDVQTDEVQMVLRGHQKKITGLAFSQSMNLLISSGADAQLCAWTMGSWEKKKSRYIHPPSDRSGALVGDTMVQFHYDQKRLLVVHESQLAIYDCILECLCFWFPRDALPAQISCAVYAPYGFLIYAGFYDGAIGIFEADSLMLQCRIAPSAYIPSPMSRGVGIVYPMVVAAHLWNPNQIAVGMSDGTIHVLEPLDKDVQVERVASGSHVASRRGACSKKRKRAR